jgi:hypothetical protein
MSEDQVLARLRELEVEEAPVVEDESGRLMGMVRSPEQSAEKLAAAKHINVDELTQAATVAREG